ncbi:MAG: hypothetical protein HQM15_07000 [Deltaproteobacteria bacterium]|nr:hypothetical protein [Deltaproteobacteria bacterium]
MSKNQEVYDVRTLPRRMHKGSVQRSDLEKYLKSLPDDAANAIETKPGDPDYEVTLEEAKEKRIQAKLAATQGAKA